MKYEKMGVFIVIVIGKIMIGQRDKCFRLNRIVGLVLVSIKERVIW